MIQSVAMAAALSSSAAYAGVKEEMAPMTPAEDVVSGVLKLDFNSHFISYGADVWGDGSSLSDPTFNPMIELAFALPSDITLTLGTWWDVNSKPAPAVEQSVGGRIQEIDVWAGLSKSFGKLSVSATYQAWMYGGTTEDILDIKFAYDTFLAPSLTLHNRLDAGATGNATGTVAVLGLSHGIEAGPVAISFPFNLAYFLEDQYHGATGDSGFGFASIGVAASLPLTPYIGEGYGDWTLNGGLTYYITEEDVIPANPQDSFLTASLGLALSF